MEADYGIEIILDYSLDYEPAQPEITEEPFTIASEEFQYDEYVAPVGKIKMPKKNKNKAERDKAIVEHAQTATAFQRLLQERGIEIKRPKLLSPLVAFYHCILQWDITKPISRTTLGMPPLSPFTSRYDTSALLYEAMVEVAFEESRAIIQEGLTAPEDWLMLEFKDINYEYPLISIEFKMLSGNKELQRAGTVFRFASQWKHQSKEVLAVVSQSSASYDVNSEKVGIMLWIHACHYGHEDGNLFTQFSPKSRWKVFALGSLITNQRIYLAALEKRDPPFMPKFLGCKAPTRITFDDDGSEVKCVSESDDAVYESRSEAMCGLNRSQWVAAEKCIQIARDKGKGHLQLIQGPPGCGKTTFLSVLLHQLLACGARVMVCTPSNKALTVLLEKFLQIKEPSSSAVLVGVEGKLNIEESTSRLVFLSRPQTASDVFLYTLLQRIRTAIQSILHALSPWTTNYLQQKAIFAEVARKLEASCPHLYTLHLAGLVEATLRDFDYCNHPCITRKLNEFMLLVDSPDLQYETVRNAGN